MTNPISSSSYESFGQCLEEAMIESFADADPESQTQIAARLEVVRRDIGLNPMEFAAVLDKIVNAHWVDFICEPPPDAYCETPLDDLRAVIDGLRPGDQPFGVVFKKATNGGILHEPQEEEIICTTNVQKGVYILLGGEIIPMEGSAVVPMDDSSNDYSIWFGNRFSLEGPSFEKKKQKNCMPLAKTQAEVGREDVSVYLKEVQKDRKAAPQYFIEQTTRQQLVDYLDEHHVRHRAEGSSIVLDDPEEGVDFVQIDFDAKTNHFQKLSLHTAEVEAVYSGGGAVDIADYGGHLGEGPHDELLRLQEIVLQYAEGKFLSNP